MERMHHLISDIPSSNTTMSGSFGRTEIAPHHLFLRLGRDASKQFVWVGVPSPCHGQNHMHMTPEPHHAKNGCWFHRRLIPYRRMDPRCHVISLPSSRRDKPYVYGRASLVLRTIKIIRPQRGPYLSIPIHPHRPPLSRYSERTILRPAGTSTRPGGGTLFSWGRNRATFLQKRPCISPQGTYHVRNSPCHQWRTLSFIFVCV